LFIYLLEMNERICETPIEFMESQVFGNEVTEEQIIWQAKNNNPSPTKPIRPTEKGENEKKHIRQDGKK
jgi:hypothetical protein